jgi:hypothetical protein
MLVLSGMSFACGSDGGDDDKGTTMDPATGNGSGNGGDGSADGDGDNGGGIEIPGETSGGGEAEDKYPECPREDIAAEFPGYNGEGGAITMTQADFMACQQKCGQDQACFTEENCPGLDAFNACANTEILVCSAKSGGECRDEYENLVCCANEFMCAPDDSACVQGNCGVEVTGIQTCIQSDMTCLGSALSACLAPPSTGDAATNPGNGTGTTTLAPEALTQMLKNLGTLN